MSTATDEVRGDNKRRRIETSAAVGLPSIIPEGPAFETFNILSNLHALKPNELFSAWETASEDIYCVDIWELFHAHCKDDEEGDALHQLWMKAHPPSVNLLWRARTMVPPIKFTKPTGRGKCFRIVKTLQTILGGLAKSDRELQYAFAGLLLDYMMVLRALCSKSDFVDKLYKAFPNFDTHFKGLVDYLDANRTQTIAVPPPNDKAIASVERYRMSGGTESFDTIFGHEEAKRLLYRAFYVPSNWPQAVQNKKAAFNGILLHGAPGVGKTALAMAAAKQSALPFFNATVADLKEKWVGSGEKNVMNLFDGVSAVAPAVIFLDEVHSLFQHQQENSGDTMLGMQTMFLQCMSKFRNIIVIGATSMPWLMDAAFVRRFSTRILVGFPSFLDRQRIFKHGLSDVEHTLDPVDFENLAKAAEGCTADIILVATESAVQDAWHDLRTVVRFEECDRGGNSYYRPCLSSLRGPSTYSEADLPDRERVIPRPVTFDEVLASLTANLDQVPKLQASRDRNLEWSSGS